MTDDGCEIYYEVEGEGDPLVFASGFFGEMEMWRHQIEEFSKDYKCIAFDTRGSGRSDKPIPRVSYGMERHRDDLDAVLNQVDANKAAIVGHSFGGNYASLYALKYPEKTAGLVLVNSFATGEHIKQAGNTIEFYKDLVREKRSRVDGYVQVGMPEDLAMETAYWPIYAIMGNAWSFLEFDITERLDEIDCPVLIVHGEDDIVAPLEPSATYLRNHLSNATYKVFEGVNHCTPVEESEKFNQTVKNWLEKKAEF